MQKLLFLDCEWVNNHNKALCQIGLLLRDAQSLSPIKEDLNLLINPEDTFNKDNVALHGITKNAVRHAPNFKEVWHLIAPYFEDALVVGHGVRNDLDALCANLARYGISPPPFFYIDTQGLAMACLPAHRFGRRYNLQAACRYLRAPHFKAHDAFADAKASLFLYEHLIHRYHLRPEELAREYKLANKSVRLQKHFRSAFLELRQCTIRRGENQKLTVRQKRAVGRWLLQHAHAKDDLYPIYELAQELILEDAPEDLAISLRKALQDKLDTPKERLAGSLKRLANYLRKEGAFNDDIKHRIALFMYNESFHPSSFFFAALRLLHLALEEERFSSEAKMALEKLIEHRDDAMFIHLAIANIRLSRDRIQKKHIALHGTFRFGDIATVRRFLEAHGATIDPKPIPGVTHYLLRGEAGMHRYLGGLGGEHALFAAERGIQLVGEASLLPSPRSKNHKKTST